MTWRIRMAEWLMKKAFGLVASDPSREADGIRFTIQNYFWRWRHAPKPVRVTVSEEFSS